MKPESNIIAGLKAKAKANASDTDTGMYEVGPVAVYYYPRIKRWSYRLGHNYTKTAIEKWLSRRGIGR